MALHLEKETSDALKEEASRRDAAFEPTPELVECARRYRIADSHCHIYPSKIAVKASAAVGVFYDIPMYAGSGDADTLLANGSAIGVERYVVCSVATTLPQVDSINRFIAGQCTEHPEFIGLGAWHEDVEDVDALLDSCEELGLAGIKVHPDFQKVGLDDPRLLRLVAALDERGMHILIHMGDVRYDYSSPAKLAAILEKRPTLKVDAAHYGGFSEWDESMRVLAGSPAYYDVSSSQMFLTPEERLQLVETFGIDKLMFGVDFPMWNHAAEFARCMEIDLSEAEREALFYGNFARFYGVD